MRTVHEPRPFYRRPRFWLILAGCLIVPILLFVLIAQFTPVPYAWIARGLFQGAQPGLPPDFATFEQNVTVRSDLSYDGSDPQNGLLDIYYPANVETPLPVIVLIHGGGFVGGDKYDLKSYGITLANAGYVVANLNYARARTFVSRPDGTGERGAGLSGGQYRGIRRRYEPAVHRR